MTDRHHLRACHTTQKLLYGYDWGAPKDTLDESSMTVTLTYAMCVGKWIQYIILRLEYPRHFFLAPSS